MKNYFLPVSFLFVMACTPNPSGENKTDSLEVSGEYVEYNNPPAKGFHIEKSDMLAMLLADKCMQAMGGRQAWDDTRYLSWVFFGKRHHLWDKKTDDVRIKDLSSDLTIFMNLTTKKGTVYKGTEPMRDSTDAFLEKGYQWWKNDSYWLIMPFKLKDSGATLHYMGEDSTQDGTLADLLRLRFEDTVSARSTHWYEIWIDVESKLVSQWARYQEGRSETPDFITPWADYKRYAQILLSANRGDEHITDIEVHQKVPEGIFHKIDIPMP